MTLAEAGGAARRPLQVSIGLYLTVPLAQTLRLIQQAERLGFPAVWVNDSQCTGSEACVTLGAAAAVTERIVLGTAVLTPSTRHISVIASTFYTLHQFTNGRVVLGLGRGELAVVLAGVARASYTVLRDTVVGLRALLAGEVLVVGDTSIRLVPAKAAPRRIPIYLGASGPLMLRLAGELADGVILPVGVHPPYVRAVLAELQDAAIAAGRSPKDIRVVVRVAYSGAPRDEAYRHVSPHAAQVALLAKPVALEPADAAVVERVRAAYSDAQHLHRDAPYATLITPSLVDKFALVGSSADCRERLRALAALGVDEVCLVPMEPDIGRALGRIADEVIAQL